MLEFVDAHLIVGVLSQNLGAIFRGSLEFPPSEVAHGPEKWIQVVDGHFDGRRFGVHKVSQRQDQMLARLLRNFCESLVAMATKRITPLLPAQVRLRHGDETVH